MELRLTVEQYAKIAEMGLTAEQVQQVVDLVVPEPEPAPEFPVPPDYSESFAAISQQLEALQKTVQKQAIINSGSDKNEPSVEESLVDFFNKNL